MTAKKTTIKTMVFFKKWLNSFLAMSGRNLVDLKPANLTNLHPVPDTFKPRIRVAERITYCTAKAINKLHNEPKKPYQDIIIYYYLDELSYYETQKKIGYKSSQYFILKRRALVEFTEYFNSFAEQEGLASIIELVN